MQPRLPLAGVPIKTSVAPHVLETAYEGNFVTMPLHFGESISGKVSGIPAHSRPLHGHVSNPSSISCPFLHGVAGYTWQAHCSWQDLTYRCRAARWTRRMWCSTSWSCSSHTSTRALSLQRTRQSPPSSSCCCLSSPVPAPGSSCCRWVVSSGPSNLGWSQCGRFMCFMAAVCWSWHGRACCMRQ